MVCHMHPGTNMVASYLGMTWWDNESDGEKMYPTEATRIRSQDEEQEKLDRNPEGASLRGLWSELRFPERHRHAGVQRAVAEHAVCRLSRSWLAVSQSLQTRSQRKSARRGGQYRRRLTIRRSSTRPFISTTFISRSGMHCVDCHFRQDSHGDGNLYNEPRAAIEIALRRLSRHDPAEARRLFTSGPAAATATGTGSRASQVAKPTSCGTGPDSRIRVRDAEGTRIPLFQRDHSRSQKEGRERQRRRSENRRHHAKLDGRARTLVARARRRSTRSRPAVATTTRSRVTRRRFAKTTRRGATFLQTTSNWPIATRT